MFSLLCWLWPHRRVSPSITRGGFWSLQQGADESAASALLYPSHRRGFTDYWCPARWPGRDGGEEVTRLWQPPGQSRILGKVLTMWGTIARPARWYGRVFRPSCIPPPTYNAGISRGWGTMERVALLDQRVRKSSLTQRFVKSWGHSTKMLPLFPWGRTRTRASANPGASAGAKPFVPRFRPLGTREPHVRTWPP